MDVPSLFPADHYTNTGLAAFELFQDLKGPSELFKTFKVCTAEASADAGCSSHYCEVDQINKVEPDKCSCYYKPKPSTSTRHCSAVARFAGLTSEDKRFVQDYFWPWVQRELGTQVGGGANKVPVIGPVPTPPLLMEDWATGAILTEEQMSAALPASENSSTSRMPSWDDSCLQLFCYCNENQCSQPDSSWRSLGSVSTALPSLATDDESDSPSLPVGGASADPDASANQISTFPEEPMATGPTLTPQGLNTSSYVFVIVGLRNSGNDDVREWDPVFDTRQPSAQRSIYGLCEGVAPSLGIVSRHCWITGFKRLVKSRGGRFPVLVEEFDDWFAEYGAPSQPGTEGEYFWREADGRVRGFYAAFGVVAPPKDDREKLSRFKQEWSGYIGARQGMASASASSPWFASALFADIELQDCMDSSMQFVVGTIFAGTLLAVFLLTWSFGLVAAVVLTLAVALLLFRAVVLGLFSSQDYFSSLGPLEMVSLTAFLSMVATPLLRVAAQYPLAFDGPGDPPVDMLKQHPAEEYQHLFAHGRSVSVVEQGAAPHPGTAPSHHLARPGGPNIVRPSVQMSNLLNMRAQGGLTPGHLHIGPFLSVEKDEADDRPKDHYPLQKEVQVQLPALAELNILASNAEEQELWMGAATAERCNRTAAALGSVFEVLLTNAIVMLFSSLALLPFGMTALVQIGITFLFAALIVPILGLGLFPAVLLLGAAPTKTWRLALLRFTSSSQKLAQDGIPARSGENDDDEEVPGWKSPAERHREHLEEEKRSAAQVLFPWECVKKFHEEKRSKGEQALKRLRNLSNRGAAGEEPGEQAERPPQPYVIPCTN
eukprot:gnl/TRDRNA2_/TRDRNA2_135873_c1_seq1.p1 gnl/TRDRNA2_/TRDRNA2_135873_c1~~gnl/TRDRNA2_/TRDRNA2_135873_c1_seq1.p1  ORF type:complete len:900 (-),score=157.24 gnl/TRDRNA2_/TRDRNA2_135873_c1_seq1:251-2740(-)